jgi:hypothetical protein
MRLHAVGRRWWTVLTTGAALGSWLLLYLLAGRLGYESGYVVLLAPLLLTASARDAIRSDLRLRKAAR